MTIPIWIGFRQLQRFTYIKKIDMAFRHKTGIDIIRKSFTSKRPLIVLSLNEMVLGDDEIIELSKVIKTLNDSSLILIECLVMCSEVRNGVEILALSFKESNLKTLHLYGTTLTHEEIVSIGKGLSHSQVEEVSLRSCGLSRTTFRELFLLLEGTNVRHLLCLDNTFLRGAFDLIESEYQLANCKLSSITLPRFRCADDDVEHRRTINACKKCGIELYFELR